MPQDSSKQLKYWLDPVGVTVPVCTGMDPDGGGGTATERIEAATDVRLSGRQIPAYDPHRLCCSGQPDFAHRNITYGNARAQLFHRRAAGDLAGRPNPGRRVYRKDCL